jgi:wyosine [tRNA(Phe)-imidazoG37] synthetase (radical SAM superfamily)
MVKICTFDCAYCQYGPTIDLISSSDEFVDWPDEDLLLEEVDKWLQRLSVLNQRLDSITFSGFGEPTLYPKLKEAIFGIKKLRDKYYPGVEVDILTNASLIKNREIFEALREIDSVIAKLDAGSQETFEDVNRPAAAVSSLDDLVENLRRLQDETGKVKLQTLIFKSTDPENRDNSSPEEIRSIAEKARVINPVEMQIYTVSRYPSDAFVTPIDDQSLNEVTSAINRILGKECAKTYV